MTAWSPPTMKIRRPSGYVFSAAYGYLRKKPILDAVHAYGWVGFRGWVADRPQKTMVCPGQTIVVCGLPPSHSGYLAEEALLTALLNQCRLGVLLRSLRLPTGARMA